MTELILKIPWLLWLTIVAAVIYFVLLVIGFIQGRKISTPFGTIGGNKLDSTEDKVDSQGQIVSQSNFQQNTMYITTFFSDQQMDDVANRVAKKVAVIQENYPNISPHVLNQHPPISERIYYILAARYEIERRIRDLVLDYGGGWAGSSWASFEDYFSLAKSSDIITKELAKEINDFYLYTQAHINSGRVPDQEFLVIQFLFLDIKRSL